VIAFSGRGLDLFDSRGSSRRPVTVTSGSEIKALFGLMGCKQFHPDKVRYGAARARPSWLLAENHERLVVFGHL